jgi:hypothetical protein
MPKTFSTVPIMPGSYAARLRFKAENEFGGGHFQSVPDSIFDVGLGCGSCNIAASAEILRQQAFHPSHETDDRNPTQSFATARFLVGDFLSPQRAASYDRGGLYQSSQ